MYFGAFRVMTCCVLPREIASLYHMYVKLGHGMQEGGGESYLAPKFRGGGIDIQHHFLREIVLTQRQERENFSRAAHSAITLQQHFPIFTHGTITFHQYFNIFQSQTQLSLTSEQY